jgi:hypothetical protein
MKLAVVCWMVMMGMGQTPDGPALQSNGKYPLKVEVIMTKANDSSRGARGFGRGNLVGEPSRGIDFTYECGTAFLNTNPGEFYQARWKKDDRRLEILMQRIGSSKTDTCDIDIAYKAAPYAWPKR